MAQNFTDSNLPIVIIDSDGGATITKNPRIGADMTIIYRGAGQRTYVSDASNPTYQDYNGRIGINVRGSSSSGFAKKQYRFETQDAAGVDLDVPLLGLPIESDWILGAPYSDKSLIRNALAFDMSREIGYYAPRTVYCELILNGDYQGVYFLTEKIKRDDNRVDVKKMLPTDTQEPEVSGGYVLKIDRFNADETDGFYTVSDNNRIVFEEPGYNELAPEQLNYVKDYFNNFESAIFANDYGASYIHYRDYINANSAIDMMLLKELSKDVDAYFLSTYMHKDREGKLVFQPVWDFNLSYGNANYRQGWTAENWMLYINGSTPQIFERMFEDPIFYARLQCRWAELRAGAWHKDAIFAKIDNYRNYLDESANRNFQRWNVLGTYLWPNPEGYANRTNYQSEIDFMKNWISNRLAWMDGQIGTATCPLPPIPALVINEIHYNPLDYNGQAGDVFEFIELKNAGTTTIDLTEITFNSGIVYSFPLGSTLAAGAFYVIAADAAQFTSKYGFAPDGDYGGGLKNGGESLSIIDFYRQQVDLVTYDDILPWPTEADGLGPSLELIDEWSDNALGENWHASLQDDGTPGAENSITLFDPCTLNPAPLLINEINYSSLASLDGGDWLELYNPTATTVDLSGWRFQDESNLFILPNGLQIEPMGYVVLAANAADFATIHPTIRSIGDFAFGLSGKGERIQLLSPERCVVDEVDYDDAAPWPISPDGFGPTLSLIDPTTDNSLGTNWAASDNAQGTPGAPNTNLCGDIPSIVINEINYNSATNTNAGDWVELHNLSSSPVSLANWELHNGSSRYQLPTTLSIPGDGYLILAENKVLFQSIFPHITNPVGDLGFGFGDDGDRIALYTEVRCLVDEVDYQDVAPWVLSPDGQGPSLSLTAPGLDNQNPANWEASPGNGTPGRENTPCVAIDFTIGNACSTLPTDFAASINLVGASYDWTFVGGNPATASGASVATTWNTSGEYSASLNVTYFECQQSISKTVNVADCNLPPVANNDTFQGSEDSVISGNLLLNDSDPESDGLLLSTNAPVNPSNGTLTLDENGDFTYNPSNNFNGNDSFTYQVCDDGTPIKCSEGIVFLTVNPVNDALVLANDQASTAEDNSININVVANDEDIDGNLDLSTLAMDNQPAANQGFYTANADGTVTFTPAANFYGTVATVTYSLCDDGTPLPATCASATINLVVTAVNDAPITTADTAATDEDSTVSGNVLNNDSDIENHSLNVGAAPSIPPTNGSVTLQANGAYTYSPAPDFNGTDSFAYQVCDDQNPPACSEGQVTITVAPINDAPLLNQDVAATGEDFPVVINILQNDNDIDGNLVVSTITVQSPPPTAQGTVVINDDGSLTFTPATDFNGTVDPITYSVCDDGSPLPSLCSTATVQITVSSQNDLPLALYDYYTTDEDAAISGNVTDNDADIDGNNLIVTETLVQAPAFGVVSMATDGSFSYTPFADVNGSDDFIYELCDDGVPSLCTQANVTIVINPINDTPSLANDNENTDEDTPINITILDNDIDIDGNLDQQTLVLLTIPPSVQGQVTVNQDGSLMFEPSPDFNGVVDIFSYKICDDGTPLPAQCATATVAIQVNSINDQPIAAADFITINEEEIATGNVLTNDTDPDDNGLSASLATAPTNGMATIAPAGQLNYTPDTNFYGTDELIYEICDDGSPILCHQTTVTITVLPVNDAPIAEADMAIGNEDEALSIVVLINDEDIDGSLDLNSLALLSNPPANQGEIIIMQDGTLVFYPAINFNGSVNAFDYQVCDNEGLCASATVDLSILPINDAPTANTDEFSTIENGQLDENVLTNDLDIDGDNIIVNENLAVQPANGSLSLATDGSFTYSPDSNFYGSDSFAYELCDTATPPLCSQGQVHIEVVPCPNALINAPASICATELVVFEAEDQGAGATYSWDFGQGALPQLATGRSVTVAFSDAGLQTIRLEVAREGCVAEWVVSTLIGEAAFAEAGDDAQICSYGALQLGGAPTGPQGASYHWTPSTGLNSDFVANPVASPSSTTTYTVTVNLGNCSLSDQVTVTVDNVATLFADAGPDKVACGNPVRIGGAPAGPIGATYAWSPTTSLDDPTLANPMANPAIATTYTLTITKNGCSQSDEVFVDKINPPIIDAGEDQTICYDPAANGAVIGGPNNYPIYAYEWSPAINLSHPTEGNSFANPSTSTTYTLTATRNGCSVSDQVRVTVDYCNDAPTAINDTLTVLRNTSFVGSLMINDFDTNNNTIALYQSPIAEATYGDLTLFEDGNIHYVPHLDYVGTDSFIYEICDDGLPNMCAQATVYLNVEEPPCVEINLKVLLEGPMDADSLYMKTILNTERHLLPGQTPTNASASPTPAGQPFNVAPWNYLGNEGADFDDNSYGETVVDWLLVSFRSGISKETELAQTAALLLKDGTVSFVNPCPLAEITETAMYIVIEHRSHLGIMSAQAVEMSDNMINFDFTLADTYHDLTSFGQKEFVSGIWCMFAGDGDQATDFPSYDISGKDKAAYSTENGSFDVFSPVDYNMDGDVSLLDKILWNVNSGVTSRVPK